MLRQQQLATITSKMVKVIVRSLSSGEKTYKNQNYFKTSFFIIKFILVTFFCLMHYALKFWQLNTSSLLKIQDLF